jgi:hypothetical protein
MTKPTREEVERFLKTPANEVQCGWVPSSVHWLLCKGYLRLLDENEKLKSWKTQAEKDLAHLSAYVALLDENERLKLTLTDERSLYADLAEKNEQLKKSIVAAKRNKVVETANDLAKLSQDGYQTAEEWTALMDKLIDALAQFGGDTYE